MKKVFLILSCCLFVGCHKKEAPPPPPLPQVVVVTPKVEDTTLFNRYVGHVKPLVQVQVTSQVEGVLTGLYFTEGQEVKKGDLIFTIDERPYEAQLAKAEAALALSVANLKYAADVEKRNSALVAKDYVSKLQYDQYTTNVLTAEAQIAENKADIETAKINLSYTRIHAPMDAVTGMLQVDVGNLIKNASDQPLVVLNQITPVYVNFSVPQKDLPSIMQLHRKTPLQVEAILNPKTSFMGSLDLIDNQVDDKTGSIWLRGVFPNQEKLLWPGEFVDVHLLLETKKGAILVPTEAISIGQGGSYVYVVREDNTVEKRQVEVGMRIDTMTIIEKGVQPNDRVVVQGQINLGPGKKVTIKSQGQK